MPHQRFVPENGSAATGKVQARVDTGAGARMRCKQTDEENRKAGS